MCPDACIAAWQPGHEELQTAPGGVDLAGVLWGLELLLAAMLMSCS